MKTVLIIDDDKNLRQTLTEKLTGSGYQVLEASSVAESLAILKNGKVDLIILDLMMPGGHGTGLIRHLDEMGLHDIPVIILSNVVSGSYQDRISEYLIKSDTSLDEVVASVNRNLGL